MNQDFNVDTALAAIESTGSYDGPADNAAPVAENATTQPTQEELIEYVTKGGKTVRESLEMLKKRAGMGYSYAQDMEAFNKEKAELLAQAERAKTLARWEEYNEFAEKNPQWAEHVQKSWENRETLLQQQGGDDPSSPLHAELQAVKAQLGELSGFLGTLKQERQQIQQAAEDKALDAEVKSIRDKYTDIDFDLADESGKSLEFRVLEHGARNGIKSFKTAFHDFYHEHLIKQREDKAKESVVKDLQARKKAGIIGVTDHPTKGLNSAQGARNKSYDQLAMEAMQELGLQ